MASEPRRAVHVIGAQCRERFLRIEHPAAQALRDLGITLAGLSDLARPYAIGRPDPAFHVVLYTLAGSGWLDVPGCPDATGPGQLVVIPAGTPTSYGLDDPTVTWRLLWFHIARSEGLGQALRRQPPVQHPAQHLARLEAAMEGFVEETLGLDDSVPASPGRGRAAELHAGLIACYLQRDLAGDIDPRALAQRQRLQQLWDEVDRNLRHPWTVSALSTRVHETQINLYRQCARHFGVKPMAMVTRLRMERARQLLRETDEPLKRIAGWVGYGNEFAFSTAFKRFAGMSPRDFRRRSAGVRR